MPEIRTMKIVVGVMTLLIGIMAALVIYGINRNVQKMGNSAAEMAGTIPVWNKALPAGATAIGISAAGSSLAVLADTPQGRSIYLIDPKTGEIRGTLTPSP